jgi:hypothetical protein
MMKTVFHPGMPLATTATQSPGADALVFSIASAAIFYLIKRLFNI